MLLSTSVAQVTSTSPSWQYDSLKCSEVYNFVKVYARNTGISATVFFPVAFVSHALLGTFHATTSPLRSKSKVALKKAGAHYATALVRTNPITSGIDVAYSNYQLEKIIKVAQDFEQGKISSKPMQSLYHKAIKAKGSNLTKKQFLADLEAAGGLCYQVIGGTYLVDYKNLSKMVKKYLYDKGVQAARSYRTKTIKHPLPDALLSSMNSIKKLTGKAPTSSRPIRRDMADN